MIELIDFGHGFGERDLYKNVNLKINKTDKIGLVGINGSGKSTFINILSGKIINTYGQIKIPKNIKIGILDQHLEINEELSIYKYLKSAFAELFKMEEKYNLLIDTASKQTEKKAMEMYEQSQKILERLVALDFYSIDSVIRKFASGLGVDDLGFDTQIKNLSGGQRAKVILCKLLLEKPDFLILDEPTNHLDTIHIEWLSNYLQNSENAFVVVSHDKSFLNKICNCIFSVEFGSISRYSGNYDSFIRQQEEKIIRQDKVRESQEELVDKLTAYINKNKCRTSTAKQAQSKMKQLEKIELVEKLEVLPTPVYNFKFKMERVTNVLSVQNIAVGYNKPLFKGLYFTLKLGEKIVISGFNGLGKTTFLKTLLKQLPLLGGNIVLEPKMKIGYFEQNIHFSNLEWTALEELRYDFPSLSEKEARSYLSRAGLTSKHLKLPIKKLSGGEQVKIKLTKFLINEYNLLILDEPTNHLDQNAKNALAKALNEFKGCVIVVSHDEDFTKQLNFDCINLEKFIA